MPDREWLKNLATARFEGGRVSPRDPWAVQHLTEKRLAATLDDLYNEAFEAAEIFNAHRAGDNLLRVMALRVGESGPLSGLLFMLGRTQIRLEFRDAHLEVDLTLTRAFCAETRCIHRLAPQTDALGDIRWSLDNRLLVNHEMIIKHVFEDLAHAVAVGDDASHKKTGKP
jgi:hypothetical protein